MDQESADELHKLISEHRVCYEVWPEYVILGTKRVLAGYDVELCGIPIGAHASHTPTMQERFATYRNLRKLAHAVIVDINEARCAIMAYDGAVRAAARRRFRQEIVLTIHIATHLAEKTGSDRTTGEGLDDLQQRLADHGIFRGAWYSDDTGP